MWRDHVITVDSWIQAVPPTPDPPVRDGHTNSVSVTFVPMETVKRRIWDGKILVRVTVSQPESIGNQEYLLIVGRVSYLHAHLPTILAYFQRYLEESDNNDWWFEYNTQPIPPNRPMGLVYDSMVGLPTGEPLHLKLRRGSYPTSDILHFDENNTLQTYWVNQLKECCYINFKNAKKVMLLSWKEHEESWDAIANAGTSVKDTYWQFWKHHSWITPALESSAYSTLSIPVRLYLSKAIENSRMRQVSTIVPIKASGTLNLIDTIPEDYIQNHKAIVQGVEVPLTSPLAVLYFGCAHPDGFLHITLVPN